MRKLPRDGGQSSSDFQRIVDAFLLQPGLPFAEVLSAQRIERIFAKHDNLFGEGRIYSTSRVVWAFLSQVLRDGKEASCQSAVARVVAHQHQLGLPVPTNDTGDYCRAREKLSEHAVSDLATAVGAEAEECVDPAWLWKGRHVKLGDGFTFTMPDTSANQAAYPQPHTQKPGLGQPIARACAVVSLATGCVLAAAVGPYKGKETGETALLRELLPSFQANDIAVFDRHYCSFLMIALLMAGGVDVCARMHHRRHVDFRRGKRLGHNDHLITWAKPARPDWMDEATYNRIPDRLELRELRYEVHRPGCRVKRITIATTLREPAKHSADDIADLYAKRWHQELDIRALKQTLNAEHLRCKSPEVVRSELWMKVLAYNLIRIAVAAAAVQHQLQPRQISFTSACQYVLCSWSLLSSGAMPAEHALTHASLLLTQIAACRVGHRPGRCEPRVLKRRRHHYPHMKKPRKILRAELLRGK